ncbi:MAG: hypothetical protein LBD11_00695 [Candidatus Peribacteria bacterium]|jgi:hypothetical protein|nr:hypothetical protein [Candidatus Peribacteria bacterium]
MKTIINRKIPIFTLITLLLIGGIFSIKVFTSASKPQPSLLRETQTLSELSANFTTSKLGIFQFPEIIITSDLNGNAITVPLATGDILKG